MNRVSLVHLAVCSLVLALLALYPGADVSAAYAGDISWGPILAIVASFTYPVTLRRLRLSTGFWKGALQFLAIFAVALACGFAAYLAQYLWYQHRSLGSDFHLFEVISWTWTESSAWYAYCYALPCLLASAVSYPLGFVLSRLLYRRAES